MWRCLKSIRSLMTMNKLSESDKIRVTGYVNVAGVEDGEEYVVDDVESGTYKLKNTSSGEVFVVRAENIDAHIGRKTFIEHLQFIQGMRPVIERV